MVDYNYVVAHWYTTAQAAEITGLTVHTIAQYCRTGRLDGVQVGRNWYVNPRSVDGFRKDPRGRKRDG